MANDNKDHADPADHDAFGPPLQHDRVRQQSQGDHLNPTHASLHQSATVASSIPRPVFDFHLRKPSAAGLHLQTDVDQQPPPVPDADRPSQRSSAESHRALLTSPNLARRSASLRSVDDFPPSSSSLPSPLLAALADVTPLPSPINRSGSPELWRRVVGRRRGSSGASTNRGGSADDIPMTGSSLLPPAVWPLSPRRRRVYPGLGSPPSNSNRSSLDDAREQPRSVSEFVPEQLLNQRQRNVSTPIASPTPATAQPALQPALQPESELHREEFLAGKKRHIESRDPARSLPSPPPSNRSAADSEDGEESTTTTSTDSDIYRVHTKAGGIHRWRRVRRLGNGTFSDVVLAAPADTPVGLDGTLDERDLDPAALVAIKILKHNPEGGAQEDRMETSIGREIEIIKSVSHPCLPKLLSFDDSRKHALLVFRYCPGGDLFDLASRQREHLTPSLIQRIFAEMVEAVRYLHGQFICHRDIKLENILFDLPLSELPRLKDPQAHRTPLVTLTDLGLAKHIPRPPESPLLTHSCGSTDYAAPEILLHQPYDGRSTDMWALGVLLYALVEGRLPFDPPPNSRRAGNVKHRIARCDWMWIEHGDVNGEWVEEKCPELGGARTVVESLLKKAGRGRWSDEEAFQNEWVQRGITTPGRILVEH